MNISQGIDIVSINRVKKVFDKYQSKFLIKILSNKEKRIFDKNKKIKFIANRFAGKEAFVKALGTGFTGKIKIRDISILNNESGKPIYEITGETLKAIEEKNNINNVSFNITLSDEKEYVIALATIIWL